MLGRDGWGILGTVSGDVGSKKVIFRGSWGHVVTFWWQASASNPSWVPLGWELGGWLGGLGAQGEPRTGGNPQSWQGGSHGKPKVSFPEALRL